MNTVKVLGIWFVVIGIVSNIAIQAGNCCCSDGKNNFSGNSSTNGYYQTLDSSRNKIDHRKK